MRGEPELVVLAVGFTHRNRDKIRNADLNVYLVGSRRIARCTQAEGPHASSSGKMLIADGPYWSESDITIGRNQVMWFKVEIREPGIYPIVVLLDAPGFYEPGDQRYEDHALHALRSGNKVATQPTAPPGKPSPADPPNDA
jgi:hypothetical protein